MRLDLFVILQYESSTVILFVVIRYSMRDLYILTSVTMLDPQTSDMRQIRHQLPLASSEFSVYTMF